MLADVEKILPASYEPLLDPKETMRALYAAKRVIEDGLCRELDLTLVQVPLIVDRESGVNDYLDRDGSRTPVSFHVANDREKNPIDAEVVQAATKWKRLALRQFGMEPGEGLLTVATGYLQTTDHPSSVTATIVPIGAGCKVCDRPACSQRAFPQLGRSISVSENSSSHLPYPQQ